ncbi:hypothetical protein KPSA3_05954 [Pseudomonas syringae pv. actinidiae]|uniref:Uncharacterized protein n=1 Tax=Pseudomonas syringae pv. actinidiae TaxID=103796 RepID=A0AAN4TNH6_PSESF|nr:hypothetical protein KPSA3_05954 [Pseudomonas syringae pv. actinidiae]
MLMALRGNLRQMRDGHDLPTLAQATQQLTHDLGSRAADAHIHFVEHQCWHP